MNSVILQNHNKEKILSRFQDVTKPYKYVFIDNFFKESFVDELLESYPDQSVLKKNREEIGGNKNILERGMYGCSLPEEMPETWQRSFPKLNEKDFVDFVEEITGIKGLLSDNHNTIGHWAGIRAMAAGGYQLIHSDARLHPHSNLEKKITFLCYLNKDWKEGDSGYLEIWNDNMEECVEKISPLYNRAIFFENTATSYHGVPEVNSYRKSFLSSYLADSAKVDETRRKALFVKRPDEPQGDLVSEVACARLGLTDHC